MPPGARASLGVRKSGPWAPQSSATAGQWVAPRGRALCQVARGSWNAGWDRLERTRMFRPAGLDLTLCLREGQALLVRRGEPQTWT